jgi:nucleotide-binding universal stress UspA family protein
MLKKILVPIDGSDHAKRAASFAADLASKYDAAIYLIHVLSFGPLSSVAGWSYGGAAIENVKGLMKKGGDRIVREAESEIKKKGVEHVETSLAEGDPASEILDFAKKNGIDMIVMGRRGMGDMGSFLLGSVSHKISNLAECICVTVK